MSGTCSFRFVDDALNKQFIAVLKESKVRHTVRRDGVVSYTSDQEDTIENELISSLRDRVFPSWQIVSCPPEWVRSYMQYMQTHNVRFVEELIDGQLSFLISRRNQPHRWKLTEPRSSLSAKVS